MQPNSILAVASSFNRDSSQVAEIAAKVIQEIRLEEDREEEEQRENEASISSVCASEPEFGPPTQSEAGVEAEGAEAEDDFEFAFVCQDPSACTLSADEIFSNGQIRPLFPIFNSDLIVDPCEKDEGTDRSPSIRIPIRKILIDGREPPPLPPIPSTPPSAESSKTSETEVETYSIWTPSYSPPPATPDRCKKSNSTGSSKLWRFRNPLHRSSSDGKDTFVFLSTSAMKTREKQESPKPKEKTRQPATSGKGKAATAHELHYVRNRRMREGDRRRSFLPYRQDLVGFFANVPGLSRTFRPI